METYSTDILYSHRYSDVIITIYVINVKYQAFVFKFCAVVGVKILNNILYLALF